MPRTKFTALSATCGCGCGCGQLRQIIRKNDIRRWNYAEKLACRVASLRADKMAHYSSKYPIELLRAYAGCGRLSRTYGVTFRAKGVDQISATYNARVYVARPVDFDDITIEHFRMVKGSETQEGEDDSKDVKLEVTPGTGFADEEQIRSERRKLAYSRARKAASRKWKSFSADVKREYLNGVIPKQELTT